VSRFWSPVVEGLVPYVPGEQPKLPNLVKLNTNENPYGPSPRAVAAMRAELEGGADALRRYPDPTAAALKAAIARRFGLAPANVFVGNGSDEVLAHAFHGLLAHDAPVLFPDVTYSFYPVYCGLYGLPFETVPLTADFAIDTRGYLGRPAGGIVFPNPNAPTGVALGQGAIERLAAGHPDAVVLVDEAYVDFGAPSAVPLLARHDNLLVVQTLSKSRSLAGLRVGFALGHPDLIEALTRVKDSFNSYPLGRLAQVGAIAALEDDEHFETTRRAVMATRGRLVADLEGLGFEVLPSAANFVFTRHPAHEGPGLFAALRERSIVVRHFRKPRIEQYLRITVGTDEECGVLIDALRKLTT